MARGKGSEIIFGKLAVHSEDSDLNEVYATFGQILTKYGYPEADIEYELVDEDDDDDTVALDKRKEPWSKNG